MSTTIKMGAGVRDTARTMERSVAVVSHQQGVDTAIDAAIGWLESNQKPEGFWVGMLESNACIEAEWLLAFHFLG